MELKSEVFQRFVLKAVEGPKPVLGIIHWSAEHRVVEAIRQRKDTLIIEVTSKNRDSLPEEIVKKILDRAAGVQH
jgi:nucleoside-triphosphatase THEP1